MDLPRRATGVWRLWAYISSMIVWAGNRSVTNGTLGFLVLCGKNSYKKMYHYYMFNKPVGCVTARKDERYPTVMDYFKELQNENLSPVGRLDLETEGLLIITDDGAWNQLMTRPEYGKEKCYEFFVLGELTEEKMHRLEQGVAVIGSEKLTAPAKLEPVEVTELQQVLPELPELLQKKYAHNRPFHPVTKGRITITEGRKRQIRRMMKAVGCLVIYLKRISMGDIVLDPALKPGEWKEIEVKNPLFKNEEN